MCNTKAREKMAMYGTNALNNAELLSVIIGIDNIKVCETALEYSSAASAKEYESLEGIGESKASSLEAFRELSKRLNVQKHLDKERDCIFDAPAAAKVLIPMLQDEKREIAVAMLLNVKGNVESIEIISIGELAATNMHPREVFNPAIRKGAAAIIVAHNHPSGDFTPSEDDIIVTKRLVEAGKVVGVKLIDHLIIADGDFCSLRTEGFVNFDNI